MTKKIMYFIIIAYLFLVAFVLNVAPSSNNIDFSKILTGETYEGQYNGGTWQYIDDDSNPATNGSLTILKIDYINHDEVDTMAACSLDKSILIEKNIFILIFILIILLAFIKLFGFSKTIFFSGILLFIINGATTTDQSVIAQALREQEGILKISYKVSYNGCWYYHSCLDVWSTSTEGIVQVPDTKYGKGVYINE